MATHLAGAEVLRRDVFVAFGIALVTTLAVYHRGLNFFFALDDYTYLFSAAGIDSEPFSLRRLLSTRIFYKLGYEVFGVSSPTPWHLVAFALHGANAAWVFALARRLGAARDAAWLACALFAASPLAFTVLHWIAGTQEVLAGFFVLACTWLALREGRVRWLSVPLFVAAMLCKESVLAAPLVLPLLAGRRLFRLTGAQLLAGIGVFIAAGLHTRALEADAASPYATDYGVGLLQNAATALVWLASPWRAYPDRVTQGDPTHLPWAAGIVLVVVVALAVCRQRDGARHQVRHVLVAGAWLIALLLPTLPLHQHFYAYYLYLPQIGVSIVFAALLLAVARRVSIHLRVPVPVARTAFGVAALLLCGAYAQRNAHTHETLTVGNSVVLHDPVVRYSFVANKLATQVQAADLPQEIKRVGILYIEPPQEQQGATLGLERPGTRRTRVILEKAALADGKFFELHFPHLQGRFVEKLTAEDEGADTAFFVVADVATLNRVPDAAAAYGALALNDLLQDRFASAFYNAKRALKLRPGELSGHLVRAGVYATQGRIEEAERILRRLEATGSPRMKPFADKVRALIQAH